MNTRLDDGRVPRLVRRQRRLPSSVARTLASLCALLGLLALSGASAQAAVTSAVLFSSFPSVETSFAPMAAQTVDVNGEVGEPAISNAVAGGGSAQQSGSAQPAIKPLIAGWTIQETPGLSSGFLEGVSCTSSTECTAVGSSVAERWNGTEWSPQTPSPGALDAVSCTSSTACTAVGSEAAFSGGTFAENWNGTTWSVQTTPNPSGATHSVLDAVSCTSSTECTAVGSYEEGAGKAFTLAERWNGTEWVIETTPSPSKGQATKLTDVSCTAPTSCMASGFYYLLTPTGEVEIDPMAQQWNGTEWTLQVVPKPIEKRGASLGAISCTSSTTCTATGHYETGALDRTLAERWNGTEWTIQSTPNPSGTNSLNSVSCSSATACTATGVTYLSKEIFTLAEAWNGTEWVIQTMPNPSKAQESIPIATSCTSSTVCVAVGESREIRASGPGTPLIERHE